MRKPYRMHIGYSSKGNDRWRYFDTLEQASKAANEIVRKTGVFLCVVITPKAKQ